MNTISKQNGVALFVSMVLLLILTIVAMAAMEGTKLEMSMSRNDNQRLNAFKTSDYARPIAGKILKKHVFERGWPEGSELAALYEPGLGIVKSGSSEFCYSDSSDCVPNDFYSNNLNSEDLENTDSLVTDMEYTFANGDGTAEIAIYKLATKVKSGNAAIMVSGYEGAGKSTAGSGASIFFTIRSTGRYNEAMSITGSDYRVSVSN